MSKHHDNKDTSDILELNTSFFLYKQAFPPEHDIYEFYQFFYCFLFKYQISSTVSSCKMTA